MAKLDEITELLTEEIEGFRKAITELHTISNELKSSEVVLDIYTIKREISELREKQDDHFRTHSTNLREFNREMATAKLAPKWLLALCCIASAVTVLTLGYFGYQFIKLENYKMEAFNNGKERIILDLRGYFDENPHVYKDFKAWSKEKDSVPNQK
jgi:hypothetical protein